MIESQGYMRLGLRLKAHRLKGSWIPMNPQCDLIPLVEVTELVILKL